MHPAPPEAPDRAAAPTRQALYTSALRRHLAPVVPFLDDDGVSEVLINGPGNVWVERAGQLEPTTAAFESERHLDAAVVAIAQFADRPLDEHVQRLDARLPDGSRVHVVRGGCSSLGSVVAIRKFSRKTFDLQRLVDLGALDEVSRELLVVCVRLRKNIVVSGGTGTGKTSFLNALSGAIPGGERILVIEDSSELQLQQEHVVPLEARPADHRGRGGVSIRDLFHSSLRLRPDRVVIGETRGAEALDLLQAMTSGHPGSMSTLHADRPVDALRRLETMALMGSTDLPHFAVRAQVASAVQVVVQLTRFADGSRRVTEIAESHPIERDEPYRTTPLLRFRPRGTDAEGRVLGALEPTGERPTFHAEAHAKGLGSLVHHATALLSEEAAG